MGGIPFLHSVRDRKNLGRKMWIGKPGQERPGRKSMNRIQDWKMNRIWLWIYMVLQCTWGLIQTIAGFAVFLRYGKCPHCCFHGAVYTKWDRRDGISLGMFIFSPDERLMVHEYGHTYQSLLLGPLYLIVIGIPSAIWANAPGFIRLREEKGVPYSAFWAEGWADCLGKKMVSWAAKNDRKNK